VLLAVDRHLVAQAMVTAAAHRLRGYNAVQLAAGLRARSRNTRRRLPIPIFVSADGNLNAAALAEGLTVDNPILHP
jgi:hypothetical protein